MIVLDDVLRRQHSRCSYRRAWRARGRASTLYGRLDSSIVRRSGEGWSLAQASTSRRGLRGGEDLGRGIMLVFQLASGFDSDTGEPQTGFRRESWIGVATRSLRHRRRRVPGSAARLIGHEALVRLENALWYESPRLGGARLSAARALDEDMSVRADAWSLRVRYDDGPIDLSIALADAGPRSALSMPSAPGQPSTPRWPQHRGECRRVWPHERQGR